MTDTAAPTAIVIGSGSAGLTVALGLVGLGRRVVLVESGPIGGDCTNVGCIHSKALLHQARSGGRTPWSTVRSVRDGLEAEESIMVDSDDAVDVVRGAARLIAAGAVVVTAEDGTERTVRAPHVVIATGSRPQSCRSTGSICTACSPTRHCSSSMKPPITWPSSAAVPSPWRWPPPCGDSAVPSPWWRSPTACSPSRTPTSPPSWPRVCATSG